MYHVLDVSNEECQRIEIELVEKARYNQMSTEELYGHLKELAQRGKTEVVFNTLLELIVDPMTQEQYKKIKSHQGMQELFFDSAIQRAYNKED